MRRLSVRASGVLVDGIFPARRRCGARTDNRRVGVRCGEASEACCVVQSLCGEEGEVCCVVRKFHMGKGSKRSAAGNAVSGAVKGGAPLEMVLAARLLKWSRLRRRFQTAGRRPAPFRTALRWWWKFNLVESPPTPKRQTMVVEVQFGKTTTNAEATNDGGGSSIWSNHHQHRSDKRWWWKCDLVELPPTPKSKTMVVEVRFG